MTWGKNNKNIVFDIIEDTIRILIKIEITYVMKITVMIASPFWVLFF